MSMRTAAYCMYDSELSGNSKVRSQVVKMLKKKTYLIYSFLFYLVSYLHLVPFKWNHKKQKLFLTGSKTREIIWRIVACIQYGHFIFLSLRLYESFTRNLRPSIILFQLVWNALFLIPVLAQINTSARKFETAHVVTEWLKIESSDKVDTKNTLLSFFSIFLPTGALHSAAHAFNYVQNPDQPQYIISVFLKYIDKHNLAYLTFFGFIELSLATLNWSLCIFYVAFLFGSASTIEAKLQETKRLSHSGEAIEAFRAVRGFGSRFSDAMFLGVIFMKIILFTCIVICVYNTIISDLPLLPFLLMPLTVIACSTVYIFCFPPLCGLYDHSQECIQKWKEVVNQSDYERKQWDSFGPITMIVGPFYKLENLVVLSFFDLIIASVINIILCFPPDLERF